MEGLLLGNTTQFTEAKVAKGAKWIFTSSRSMSSRSNSLMAQWNQEKNIKTIGVSNEEEKGGMEVEVV